MMLENWATIAGKTAIQRSEIDQAQSLAERLITRAYHREQARAVAAETPRNRQKAFTLFVSTYDQIRRVISFVRWNEGDGAGRGGGRQRSSHLRRRQLRKGS
jgi:hypothetical protein